jgi:hypothetical protein
MTNSGKGQWGGKRAGAGRPRDETVREVVAETGRSRTAIYRVSRRIGRLTPEAREFVEHPDHTRFITGRALEIAGEFDTAEEQIATLKLAIKQRVARKRLSFAHAILNAQDDAGKRRLTGGGA